MMKSKWLRFVSILIAVGIAVLLLVFFSYLGKKGEGPVEDIFSMLGSNISELESEIILNNRTEKRSDKLSWLLSSVHPDGADTMLLGAFDNNTQKSFKPVLDLEDSLNTHFPIISIYVAWGDKPDQRFPSEKVQAITDLGSIPLITWEPWLSDFDDTLHEGLEASVHRDKKGLKDISKGLYDFYLDRWIRDMSRVEVPVMIRLAHEMNDSYRYPWGPQNNEPQDFIDMWIYVHEYFRERGVENVIWVWSPHPAYKQFELYYPGDAYVDWIGVGTLNYGTVAVWSKWWTFDEIFGNHYPELSKYNKPIILTEFASLPVGGERKDWYADALCDLRENYPLVNALIFFHFSNDNTTTYKSLNWYIINDSSTLASIRGCLD